MEVRRAAVLGYCAGVRRAMETALKEAEHSPRVFTEGALIHNTKALEILQRHGIEKTRGSFNGATVVIRAHGITPAREAELTAGGARIADATCPKVKRSQLLAGSLARKGVRIFLAGEKTHAEIAGIMGYADCIAVETPADAERAAAALMSRSPAAPAALLGQTTISPALYQSIAAAIRKFFPDLKVIDTICSATRDRQEALRNLDADALVVIGGKESANSRNLFSIAQESGKPAYFIQDADELPEAVFAYKTVGISAGASTPDEIIGAVEQRLIGAAKE